jgi:hypothetical protein
MGIFDTIKNAIFGHASAAEATAAPASTPTMAPQSDASSSAASSGAAASSSASSSAPGTSSAAASGSNVDVSAVMDKAVAAKGEKLDWRRSIVDLMKALDLDSSLAARKELAKELHYTGDTNDSGAMNMWLHKALMQKLAENGGKVPADLAA